METLENNNLTDFSLDKNSTSIMSIEAAAAAVDDYYNDDDDHQSVPIMFDLVPVEEGEVIELKFYLEQFVSHENLSQLMKECENYKSVTFNSTPNQEPALRSSGQNENCEENHLTIVLDDPEETPEDLTIVLDDPEETPEDLIIVLDDPEETPEDLTIVLDDAENTQEDSRSEVTTTPPTTSTTASVEPEVAEQVGPKICRRSRIKKIIKSRSLLRKPKSRDGPVNCPICNKSIAQRKNLNVHLNVHKKPYQCTYCSRRFAHEYLLNRHQVRHQKQSTTTTTTVTNTEAAALS